MLYSNPFSIHAPDMTEQLIDWVYQAGQIALHHFKNVIPQNKPDQSFFTQADLEIERFLTQRIRTAYHGHSLISEEGTRVKDICPASDIWVIDPLDGTTAFVQGLSGWGISIGLLHEGQPDFGLFYMPLIDDMTYTNGHTNVRCGGSDLCQTIRTDWREKGFLAVSASAHRDFQINVHRTRTMGSVGASLAYTARGAAVATFIPKARLWDLVAGAAILGRMGGELRYLSGKSIDYLELLDGRLAPEPVIAGHPHLLAELSGLIRSRSS
jgi:fructose-1,6-bisphosphatase/inositol monophosphatase family enzyme